TAELAAPAYQPAVTVSPASLAERELAETGVAVTGSGFAPRSDVQLSVSGTPVDDGTTDDGGRVTFTFRSATPGPGTHTVLLSAPEGSATTTFTVVADAPEPEPEPEP